MEQQPSDKGLQTFRVWAPEKEKMQLHIVSPEDQIYEMQKNKDGYFYLEVTGLLSDARYYFRPDGDKDYPDPASHFQPEGVHGPSQRVDHTSFVWHDQEWKGIPFNELVIYELHVGTFSREGTFEAIIPFLDEIAETGVNAIELMPVVQFPGNYNWGYDQTYPYAVQNSYGGPEGLKKLIDACHRKGIAVFLDVVYNHLGPEGNYFENFAPWFTDKYKTPWGKALNYDGEWSDGVREYFSNNVIYWFEIFHADGLRCDAIHMIYDTGAIHFWDLVQEKIKNSEQKLGRRFYLIAESDLNSPRVTKSTDTGGFGFTAQWLDDFHHALYTLLDKNGKKYYEDFGHMEQLAKAYKDGFVHSGEYVVFRKRKHGASSAGIDGDRFVVFTQDHDIVGNRPQAERLTALLSFEQLKLAAAALLLSPYIPMLFMGEEYAEDNPFYYFINHSDPELIKAVREGRKKEFQNFHWENEPPDPQDDATFNRSKLDWSKRSRGKHSIMLKWYRKLIAMRREHPLFQSFSKNNIHVSLNGQKGLTLHKQSSEGLRHLVVFLNFADDRATFTFPLQDFRWEKILDSKENEWVAQPERENALPPGSAGSDETVLLQPFATVIYETRDER